MIMRNASGFLTYGPGGGGSGAGIGGCPFQFCCGGIRGGGCCCIGFGAAIAFIGP